MFALYTILIPTVHSMVCQFRLKVYLYTLNEYDCLIYDKQTLSLR